jgi:hypothetical protein
MNKTYYILYMFGKKKNMSREKKKKVNNFSLSLP